MQPAPDAADGVLHTSCGAKVTHKAREANQLNNDSAKIFLRRTHEGGKLNQMEAVLTVRVAPHQ